MVSLLVQCGVGWAVEELRGHDGGFGACERVNSEQPHSQSEGAMTYQLGIAMAARKRKRKTPAALGGRDVLYGGRVGLSMCRDSIAYPRGSRGPFSQGLFPCSSPAKPHRLRTLPLQQLLASATRHMTSLGLWTSMQCTQRAVQTKLDPVPRCYTRRCSLLTTAVCLGG